MTAAAATSRVFTVGLVASWYSSNIRVLILNKYLLSNYGFKYPIFLTMCHMTACSLLSYVAIVWMKAVPMQSLRSRVQFLKISALSLILCVSVVFDNVSLRYLPVSFNQAIGATTPFFTAVFTYLMTFNREAFLTYLALVPVVAGVIIAIGLQPRGGFGGGGDRGGFDRQAELMRVDQCDSKLVGAPIAVTGGLGGGAAAAMEVKTVDKRKRGRPPKGGQATMQSKSQNKKTKQSKRQ